MIKRIFLIFSALFSIVSLFSQQKITSQEYIDTYSAIAVAQMHEFKIPASITLAQGILESGNGNSALARKAKNHFGIKCHKDWKGKGYYMDDDAKNECFRVYKNPKESYRDHSLFLSKRQRYAFLFEYKITDYKKWAHGLKKAGYATNPKYPQLLISIIERYKLYAYDSKKHKPNKPQKPNDDLLVLDQNNEEDFSIEQTDQYIKALMGKNVYYSDAKKGIFIFNRIKTIKAKNRSALQIANDFGVNYERLLRYNDATKDVVFAEQQNVFLQPKRFNGSQKKYLVKPGDGVWEISQMFGIKESALRKKNLLSWTDEVKPGQTLYLRKKRKNKPKTISYKDLLKMKRKIAKEIEAQKPKPAKKPEQKIEINIINKIEVPKEEKTPKTEQKIYPDHKYTDKNEPMKPVQENVKTFVTHIVKAKETLYSLSRKYGVSVEQIKQLNQLKDNSISIGQTLIISEK